MKQRENDSASKKLDVETKLKLSGTIPQGQKEWDRWNNFPNHALQTAGLLDKFFLSYHCSTGNRRKSKKGYPAQEVFLTLQI
jgi:hypothetical protein